MRKINLEELKGELTEIEAKNAPKELFIDGDESLLIEGRRVSVVGSRNVSPEGLARTKSLVKMLVELDFIIVSGLAKGVDTMAHKTAIEYKGKTIAVVGSPLDKVYPAENKELLDEIKRNHLAISQFRPGIPIQGKNFPQRNKTMALISDATIIVEASEKSGTKHQGWEALRLGRSLFILENITNDPKVTWTTEMISYGAEILNRYNFNTHLENVQALTRRKEFAF
ncbi:DNA-processing protein DprA [Marivirga sericea]|nr:DNA-processing protein DprA [Marivirga sericea]